MIVLIGKFDGKHVVFEKPPQGIAPGTRVTVVTIEDGASFAEVVAEHAMKEDVPPPVGEKFGSSGEGASPNGHVR